MVFSKMLNLPGRNFHIPFSVNSIISHGRIKAVIHKLHHAFHTFRFHLVCLQKLFNMEHQEIWPEPSTLCHSFHQD